MQQIAVSYNSRTILFTEGLFVLLLVKHHTVVFSTISEVNVRLLKLSSAHSEVYLPILSPIKPRPMRPNSVVCSRPLFSCSVLQVSVGGGAGFIGSHLAKKLKAEGCYVVCADWKENEFMRPEVFIIQ